MVFLATALVATLCVYQQDSLILFPSFSLSRTFSYRHFVALSLFSFSFLLLLVFAYLASWSLSGWLAGWPACLVCLLIFFQPFSLKEKVGEYSRQSKFVLLSLFLSLSLPVCVSVCSEHILFYLFSFLSLVFAFCCVCLFVSRIAIFSYLLEFQKCFSCFCFSLVITAFRFATFSF